VARHVPAWSAICWDKADFDTGATLSEIANLTIGDAGFNVDAIQVVSAWVAGPGCPPVVSVEDSASPEGFREHGFRVGVPLIERTLHCGHHCPPYGLRSCSASSTASVANLACSDVAWRNRRDVRVS
jgi:hypothetical protein